MEERDLGSDLKADAGEKPLHVLKYDPWRMAWRLLWPTLPGLVIFSLAAFYKFQDDPSATIIFVRGAGLVLLAGTLYITFDTVMTGGFYLYGDRIVKRYRTGQEKSVPLGQAKIGITQAQMIAQIFFTSADRPKLVSYIKDVYIDTKLAKPGDVAAFKDVVAEVSGQDRRDLDRRYFAAKLMTTRLR